MTANTLTLFIHDDTAFYQSGQTNYGPIPIGSGFTITKTEIKGSLAFSPHTTPPTGYLADVMQIGVQYGSSGYTPYDFETEAEVDEHTWLMAQTIPASPVGVFWTPETNSSQVIDRYLLDFTIYSQIVSRETIADFYLSISQISDLDPFEYRLFASFRMWFE